MELEDRKCSGHPSFIDEGQLKTIIEKDPRKSTRGLAEYLQLRQQPFACDRKKQKRPTDDRR